MDKNRRKLLQSIGISGLAYGALPEKWQSPVVDVVSLPAHADSSPVCCAGVFCDLSIDNDMAGSAEVGADCSIYMAGPSAGGDWSASGTVDADGSFSIVAQFEAADDAQITGTVEGDCLRIIGSIQFPEGDPFGFGGSRTAVDSIDDCVIE